MAEQAEKANTTEAKEANGGGQTNGGGRKAVRAAAIAAATGATAIAAKKAFSGRSDNDEGDSSDQAKPSGGSEGDSMFTEMLSSGWSAAKDSLLPFAEEAAGAAGEWVARSGPELVSDTLVPRFIRGFEGAKKSSNGSDDQ